MDLAGYKKSPEIMRERGREILARLGYAQEPADDAWGFTTNGYAVSWVLENDSSPERWDRMPDDTYLFWYREAPRPMSPEIFNVMDDRAIRVGRRDPPLQESGMSLLHLDRDARLERLEVVPPQKDESAGPHAPPDWPALFREAGIDMSRYRSVEPQWAPPIYADARAAWVGPHPDRPSIEARIEAAAYRGRPVNFLVRGPWNPPTRQAPYQPSTTEKVAIAVTFGVLFVMLAGAVLMARRNLRLGRGDAAGARKLGAAILMASLVSWLLGSSHTATFWEILVALNGFGSAVFSGFMVAVFYLAVEPYVRRRWPQTLVSWSRAISGRWRDPAVGREILIGAAGAVAITATTAVAMLLPRWLGHPWGAPIDILHNSLAGLPVAVSTVLERLIWGAIVGTATVFLLTAFRAGLKRAWAAGAVFILFNAVTELGSDFGAGWVVATALWGAVAFLLMFRFGVLALVTFNWLSFLLMDFPITTDTRAWYFGAGALGLAVLAGVVVWGARTAARGRKALPLVSEAGQPVRA
jgi:serine/threonine-protein kinase